MKTQISRNSQKKAKRYSALYQQQGRAVLDSDINELSDIVKMRLNDALDDAIGSGAPATNSLIINADKSIQPGRLYVEGVPAVLLGDTPIIFTGQPDLVQPTPLPASNFQLYADVWERTVTSIEDRDLLDPGLHGADTCTRTQTMLQVKWADNTLGVMDEVQNPSIGNAPLRLSLRQIFVSEDPCDPCAIEVEIDERIGNYLFRVEVHEVFEEDGSTFMTLKWSRDNGAEQFVVASVSSDFKMGDYSYEFFDAHSEKNLGAHFMGNRVKRGTLTNSYLVPAGVDEQLSYVRQWDGFCTINLTTSQLVSGIDRGVLLSHQYHMDAHGYYNTINAGVIGDEFSVNLELLQLQLRLVSAQFVAGDYWYSAVREAVTAPGDYVLGEPAQGELPQGVKHHYLVLATADATGALTAQSDAQRRQFHFPALNNIMADDIGFIEHCDALFHGAQNVQQAMDALCDISAADIAYLTPNCSTDTLLSYLSSLPGWPDLDRDDKISVKDMLDALLCHLSAHTLPYQIPQCVSPTVPSVSSLLAMPAAQVQPLSQTLDTLLCELRADHIPLNRDSLLCSDLKDAITVQEALQILCLREMQGGCSISIDGINRTLDGELAKFQQSINLDHSCVWLCLHALQHIVEKPIPITGKQTLKMIGSGAQASVVTFKGEAWNITAKEVVFRDITFVLETGESHMQIHADNIVIENCQFIRVAKSPDSRPLIEVAARGNRGNLRWQGNSITAMYTRILSVFEPGDFTLGKIAENSTIVQLLDSLLGVSRLSVERGTFTTKVQKLAEQIEGLSKELREEWSELIPKRKISRITRELKNTTILEITPIQKNRLLKKPLEADLNIDYAADKFLEVKTQRRGSQITAFYKSLATDKVSLAQRGKLITNFIINATESGFASGLGIVDPRLDLQISESRFDSTLVVNSQHALDGRTLNNIKMVEGDFVRGENQFLASNNNIHRIETYIAAGDPDGIDKPVVGYQRCLLKDNEFTGQSSTVLGDTVEINNNYFSALQVSGSYLHVFGTRVMICHNITEQPDAAGIQYLASRGDIVKDNMGRVFSKVIV